MGCLDADTVLALLDGGLSDQRVSEIEGHLDDCAACRRVVSETAAAADTEPSDAFAPAELALPDRLGPYELRGAIGRGGMGEVMRAYDPRLNRQVAIKLIRPHGRRMRAEDLDWFEREARAAAAISHANVLAVFDVGHHDGHPYVVTELLDGESLRARLARGPIATRQAVAWACELARGMAAAHERGIVHRDIKPDNVFITQDGHVKLLDFGVAAVTGAASELEPRGLVVGTLGYMAPEQIRGDDVDHRADVFAFGAVVFEMLTGRPAFRGSHGGVSAIERAEAALHDDPLEREPGLVAGLAAPIVQVVRRCLEKAPAARFQSARDLGFALELAGEVRPSAPRARRWPWLAGAIALAGGAISATIAWSASRPAPGPVVPPAPTVPPAAAVVTRMDCRAREVFTARQGPGGMYVTVAAGDGVGIEGLGALRVLRRSPDGALAGVPHTEGTMLLAANASSLLILRGLRRDGQFIYGRLARIDREGNDLPIPDNPPGYVLAADFMPDGSIAAIRSIAGDLYQVEAPLGKVVYEVARDPLTSLRISAAGAIAFVQFTYVDTYWKSRFVTLGTDRDPRQLGDWHQATSVAWSGDDLLVGGSRGASDHGIWRFGRGGRAHLVWSAAYPVVLHDVTGDGALLATQTDVARHVRARRPGWDREHDLSLSDHSDLVDLSFDGRWLSGVDATDGNHAKQIYLRALGGGEPILVGRGAGGLLTRDARVMLSRTAAPPWRLVATTLAAPGEPIGTRRDARELAAGEPAYFYSAGWRSADTLVLLALEQLSSALYEQSVDGAPRRLGRWTGAQRIGVFRVSPDGATIADLGPDGRPALIDIASQKVTPLATDRSLPVGWSVDGTAVWLATLEWPVVVTRHPLHGKETVQLTIRAPEPGSFVEQLRVAGDGATYAYSYATLHSELYRVEAPL